MAIKVDPDSSGNSPYPIVTQTNTGCTSNGCPATMTVNWTMQSSTYGDGDHTVEVDTTDAAGNTDTETLTFTLVGIDQLGADTISLDGEGSPTITGAPGSQLGASVADVGDVNGDGLDDFLVGAPDASCDGRMDVGAAYLILGSTNTAPIDVTVPDSRVITFCGASTGDKLGTAVAAGGDVNGDGYPDLLIGAPGSGGLGLLPQGKVYVIFGGPNIGSMNLANFTTGDQATVPGSGFLINGPALSTNLNLGLGHPAPVPFGASLGTRHLGDNFTTGDFNGDGLDDIVIGDSGDSPSLRVNAGTVWVIYGKTDVGTIDLNATGGETQGANLLNPTVNTGIRIEGANGLDETGQGLAWPGSTDGSGYASLLITAPGLQNPQANNLLAPSGGAYVLFGNSNYPSDLDLSELNQAGGPNGYRIYGPAAANVASAAPVGDIDGDQIPDILLGGNNAAWVIAGKSDTGDVYLNDAYDGYEITAPDSTYGPAQVAGLGDMDRGGTPDTLISFPSATNGAGTSFLVYGRPDMTDLNLANVDGSQATQITGPGTGQAGTSADGVDGDRAGNSQPAAIIGDPGTAEAAAVSSSKLKVNAKWGSARITCVPSNPNPAWSYPYPSGTPVNPQTGTQARTLPVCRLGRYGQVPDRSLTAAKSATPDLRAWNQGNARKTDANLSLADEQTHKAETIVDSLGNPIAKISWQSNGCFKVYNAAGASVGYTTPYEGAAAVPATTPCPTTGGGMQISFTGKGCMANTSLENNYVGFQLQETTGVLRFQGLQGYISNSALPTGTTSSGGSDFVFASGHNFSELEAAYPGCGPADKTFTKSPSIPAAYNMTTLGMAENFPGDATDFGDGTQGFFRDSYPTAKHDFGNPLSRNQGLSGLLDGTNGNPNEGFLFDSSSAVQAGDIVRAMLPKGTKFTELDYMSYPDPNEWQPLTANPDHATTVINGQTVPLIGSCAIARWVFGRVTVQAADKSTPPRQMFGWVPFRDPTSTTCAPLP